MGATNRPSPFVEFTSGLGVSPQNRNKNLQVLKKIYSEESGVQILLSDPTGGPLGVCTIWLKSDDGRPKF